MPSLRLTLFGGFQAGSASGAAIAISSKKGRALLAYLASQRGRGQTREKLIGLLWSEREQAQAYNSLRHELVELKRVLAPLSPPPLVIDGDTVALGSNAVAIDVAEFERRAGDGTTEGLHAAAELYSGEFLDGLVVRDSAFEDWLTQERGRLCVLAIGVFDRLTTKSVGVAAVAAAKQLLALDPLREASYRTLMRVHAEQGETDLALRQYEACREMLQRELGIDPAAETERLYREIRDSQVNGRVPDARVQAAPAPTQPSAESHKASIAVLPFEVVGQTSDLETIARGLVEDITTGLARFRLVSVISRQFGRETAADYALTGSLRRSGERIRATAQLIETETGRELWAERYDRSLVDHFAIQDELTQAILAGIEHVLVAAEHRRGIASSPNDERSLNQKAGWYLFRFTREDSAKAIALLRQAIAENPHADRRYQGLSLALGLELTFGWANRPDETIAEMVAAAERGVSLGEHDAWNHAPLSWGLVFARQFERATAELRRMIELNPNSGVSYGVSALVLGYCGAAEAALDALDKARRMAPQAPFMFNYLFGGALALYRLGRYAEAVDMAESSALRRPNYFQPQVLLAAALALAGEGARARTALAAAHRLAPAMSATWLEPLVPLRETADFARLVDGLRKAGWPG